MEECVLNKRLNDQLGNKQLQAILRYFIMNTDLFAIPDLINEHIMLECFDFSFDGHHILRGTKRTLEHGDQAVDRLVHLSCAVHFC
ncbi:hypothetical protein D3C73_1035560 [compost metagenome]